MQRYPIPVPSLNTAQQYAETAGSLAEALHGTCSCAVPASAPTRRTPAHRPRITGPWVRGTWREQQYHSRRPYGLSPAVRWCRP